TPECGDGWRVADVLVDAPDAWGRRTGSVSSRSGQQPATTLPRPPELAQDTRASSLTTLQIGATEFTKPHALDLLRAGSRVSDPARRDERALSETGAGQAPAWPRLGLVERDRGVPFMRLKPTPARARARSWGGRRSPAIAACRSRTG